MAHQSDLIASDIEAYLKSHQYRGLLRFITRGSMTTANRALSADCYTNQK